MELMTSPFREVTCATNTAALWGRRICQVQLFFCLAYSSVLFLSFLVFLSPVNHTLADTVQNRLRSARMLR